jgi:hypothetical protein
MLLLLHVVVVLFLGWLGILTNNNDKKTQWNADRSADKNNILNGLTNKNEKVRPQSKIIIDNGITYKIKKLLALDDMSNYWYKCQQKFHWLF